MLLLFMALANILHNSFLLIKSTCLKSSPPKNMASMICKAVTYNSGKHIKYRNEKGMDISPFCSDSKLYLVDFLPSVDFSLLLSFP